MAAITALSVPALMVSAQPINVQAQRGMEQQIDWEESGFEEIQSHILERLDSQIGNLQEHRNEVASAQSKDDLLNIKKENMKERLNEMLINIDEKLLDLEENENIDEEFKARVLERTEEMKANITEQLGKIDGASSAEELRQIQKQNFHGAKKGMKEGMKGAREWRRQNGPIFNSES